MVTDTRARELLACPFCGATPHRGSGKLRYDQLHGDPLQDYSYWCPHGCAKVMRGSETLARRVWNTRTPSPDAEEMREAAAKAVMERLYPKNPESDWTEFAAVMAGAAVSAVEAICSLPLPTPSLDNARDALRKAAEAFRGEERAHRAKEAKAREEAERPSLRFCARETIYRQQYRAEARAWASHAAHNGELAELCEAALKTMGGGE